MTDRSLPLFPGTVVIVTGAARGIGAAVALAYFREGAHVIAWDKDDSAFHSNLAAADGSHSKGSNTDGSNANDSHVNGSNANDWDAKGSDSIGTGSFTQTKVDVSQPDDVKIEMQRVAKQFGKIDILINNAGFGIWKSPLELAIEEWDAVINTNLRGTFVCAREAAPYMEQGSAIVNIASTRAFMSEPNSEAYAASKGGIVAVTHALAASLGPNGIRVNVISPGWIETKDYESLKEEDHVQHPAQRVGRPSDIAQACFYLTDRRNDFVTGINVTVDGGMTHKMIYVD